MLVRLLFMCYIFVITALYMYILHYVKLKG